MKEQLHTVDMLLSKGEVKKAEVLVTKLLRSNLSPQEQVDLLIYHARIRLFSTRPEDALEDLRIVSELSPTVYDSPAVLELKGDCHFSRFEMASVGFAQRDDIFRAEQIYQTIIHNSPHYANLGWVYYQLGRVHATTNRIDEAIECFQQALLNPTQVKPLTSYCYERLGFIAYYEQRDLEKALSFLNRAVDTYPPDENPNWLVEVHILRSRVFRGMRDYEAAWKAGKSALQVISRDSIESKNVRSEALLATAELLSEIGGRDKEVITYLQQFIQNAKKPLGVDVTWSRVNEMLGNACFNLGQYENAIAAYHDALQFNPDHPWETSLHHRIARSHYQQKNYQHAINTIEQILSIAKSEGQVVDDYRVYDLLGSAFFALGRYDQAIAAYEMALQMAPPSTDNFNKIKSYHDLARELI